VAEDEHAGHHLPRVVARLAPVARPSLRHCSWSFETKR
jgi:hypothetical protein